MTSADLLHALPLEINVLYTSCSLLDCKLHDLRTEKPKDALYKCMCVQTLTSVHPDLSQCQCLPASAIDLAYLRGHTQVLQPCTPRMTSPAPPSGRRSGGGQAAQTSGKAASLA